MGLPFCFNKNKNAFLPQGTKAKAPWYHPNCNFKKPLTALPVAAYCIRFSRTAPKGTSPSFSVNMLSAGGMLSLVGI